MIKITREEKYATKCSKKRPGFANALEFFVHIVN